MIDFRAVTKALQTVIALEIVATLPALASLGKSRIPTPHIDVTVYRDLADLFEAIEDDEDGTRVRDCDFLRRLADSIESRPSRLRNAH